MAEGTMPGPVLFPTQPTLVGRLCTLRPFTADDIAGMGPILADPEVLRLTGSVASSAEAADRARSWGRSRRLDDETRRWYETRGARKDRLDLAVVDNTTGCCVGEVVLNDWRPDENACNFRILLGPAGRDRGIGSEATSLLLGHAFASTSLHRIELEVYAFNPRARRVYEKAGFTMEGTLPGALRFDGEPIDAVTMAALRPDTSARVSGA